MKQFQKEQLTVKVHSSRDGMARDAAQDVAGALREALARQKEIRIVFGAAPSQTEFLGYLTAHPGIDWSRVVSFHMDEYVGLPPQSRASFVHYLEENVWSKARFGGIHRIRPTAGLKEAREEAERYAKLFCEAPIDFVCLGIGENGHIAFNDPPVADFEDRDMAKVVELEESCRRQQVHDGCFSTLREVPTHAITLTIPALLRGGRLFCVVPAKTKARAVRDTLTQEISARCPATVLRAHPNACLYLDPDSASLLERID